MLKRPMYFFLGTIIIISLCYNYFQSKNLKSNKKIEEGIINATGIVEKVVEKEKSVAVYLKNVTIYSKKEKMKCAHILVYLSGLSEPLINGTQVKVEGKLEYFKPASNLGQFNEMEYYQVQNVTAKIRDATLNVINQNHSFLEESISSVKKYFLNSYCKVFNKDDSGIIEAMLLGEKQSLNPNIKQLYQSAGIAHILAISGLHISLMCICLFRILRKLGLHIYAAIFISIAFIWYYGKLTDFSVSTNRAVIMMSLMLFARILGRTYDIQSAAALSAGIILLQQPKQIENCSFLLSFGAIIGITLVYPVFEKLYALENKEKVPEWKKKKLNYWFGCCFQIMKKSVIFSFSITLITLPVILYFYYEISVCSILLNLIVIPLISIVLICSVIAGLLTGIFLPFGYFFAGSVHVILLFYQWMSEKSLNLPFSIITVGKPAVWKILFYYVVIILSLVGMKIFSRKRIGFALVAAIFILCIPHHVKGLEVTFLDVGQGDCIFMKNEKNISYLIDCGSSDVSKVGMYRLKPFLKASGNKTLTYVIITHTDLDHISGIQELLEEENLPGAIKIKHLVLPKIAEEMKDDTYLSLIETAREKKIPILYIEKNDIIIENKMKITCLHPYKTFLTDSSNAYSTVLSVEFGNFSMLLTGDLEKEGEESIMKNDLKDYDVLKVAHHGSKFSSSEKFLDIIKPEYAILSYGNKNKYGHPHKELLSRLEARNITLYRTERNGSIRIQTDGKKMHIKTFFQEK